MDLSKIFVDRPILAAVLSIMILVAGLIAIPNLPISEYPEVVPPSIQVTAVFPGANPQTISETVAAPLEEVMNGVEGMIYMKSASSSDGVMVLTVTFEGGTDIDLAAVQVQNRVAQALPRLPESVRALGVTTAKASPNLTMVVHLKSPDGRYDGLYLSNYANLRVQDEISRLRGVGQAVVFGIGDYSMRVWLDPEKAAARNLTAGDIVNAIREQNVQVSAGVIGGPPSNQRSDLQLSINVQGRLESPEEFGDIVIKTGAAGELTRLRDVARIELGADAYALRSLLDNEQAAAIAIFQSPGANSIALSDNVRSTMAELAESFPEGVEWTVVYDPTVFVRQSIRSVVTTLLEAVLLVVIVVVLFLQTWRASIIPLLAVPVSIIGTFAVLWLMGFSINVLTLFGLVLAIGIVVDDAIVVVENVERHIEDGADPRTAAHEAMAEVSGPIVAISLVLASVFVPLSFLEGVTGQFYRQFAVTIAVSVLISAVNSLTLSPALAAILLKSRDAPKDLPGRIIDSLFGWLFRGFNRVFNRGSERYSGSIAGVINRRAVLFGVYAVLIGVAFMGFRAVPGGFIPVQDKQYLFGVLLLPEGATIDRTEQAIRTMSEMALEVPGVTSAVAFPGLNAVHFVNTPNIGTIFFGIDPAGERQATAAELAGELSGRFSAIREGLAFALMPPPLLGLGNSSGIEMYIQDRAGVGFGPLNDAVQALSGQLRGTPGFDPYSVLSSYQPNVPQLSATVNRTKAKEQGLALTDVYDTLQVYLGSAYVNDFNLFGRIYSVYAQADAAFRDDVGDIARLKVRNVRGDMVPIGSVVDVQQSFGPDPVIRYNGYPAADLSAGINPAQLTSTEAVVATEGLAAGSLPKGISLEWTNLTYQQVTQGNASLLVFPLCILLVYLVLAALYESWSLPFSVILIVPMCLLSAIGGIWVLNQVRGMWFGLQIAWEKIPPPPMSIPPTFLDNNIFTQIGLVVLMGLACKNAILIVEFARDLERAGRDTFEAAVEACRLRLRPILMTSFAFIAGVLPLVFATGAGSEVRHVMGVTVFFGMLGVTFFGLFFTPVFYVAIRGLAAAMRTACEGKRAVRSLSAVLAATCLAGCTAGPDYEPPEMRTPVEFANASAPEYGAGVPDGSVWQSFDDAALSALLNAALMANTDIGVALARLDESRALSGLSIYTYFPTVTAQANQVRATQSADDPFGFPVQGVIERYSASFDATWEIDLFGSLRRQLEQIEAIVESDAASLNQVRLSVMGDVAQSYFTLRGTRAQLTVQENNRANQARAVEILEASRKAGRGTALDVAQARALERSLAAVIPNTEAAVARAEQRLAVLTSLTIAELRELLGSGGDLPAIPERIELGQPDEWLRRRPDVQAVERQLAAASAAIGVEAANYWPRVDLVGSFGWNAQSLSNIGSEVAEVWSAGPTISWRFLDAGRVRQRVLAAQAQERQAFETFRGTVQLALEEMENSLANFRAANRVVIALQQALAQSDTASRLSRLRFDTGRSSYLEVLDAERTRLGLVDQLAAARTNQATALIAVYKALAAY